MRIIEVSGPARRAGVRPGELLLAVNGQKVRDVLDYRFLTYDGAVALRLASPDGTEREVALRHREGGDVGLVFESYLMDTERTCRNKCVFCFIDQNPPGCRESLYVKDDDARLSFLLGNYITLTNIGPSELDRLIRLRVSPLGISVHTTDPVLRAAMLRNPRAGQCLPVLRRLAQASIVLNCQIVLCPGWNDGAALEATLSDLCGLGDAVRSVSVVPVGLTAHRAGLTDLRPVTAEDACRAVETAERWPRVYCSDEMYLRAGLPPPPAAHYDGYPQLENGVGMLALFEEEWSAAPPPSVAAPLTLATGIAAAPFFRRWLRDLPVRVVAVENRFFGGGVDVAGLLSGRDFLRELLGRELGERVLIPASALRHGSGLFLDGMTVEQLSLRLAAEVRPLPPDAASLRRALAGETL